MLKKVYGNAQKGTGMHKRVYECPKRYRNAQKGTGMPKKVQE